MPEGIHETPSPAERTDLTKDALMPEGGKVEWDYRRQIEWDYHQAEAFLQGERAKIEATNPSIRSTLHAEATNDPSGVNTESNRGSGTIDALRRNLEASWNDLSEVEKSHYITTHAMQLYSEGPSKAEVHIFEEDGVVKMRRSSE